MCHFSSRYVCALLPIERITIEDKNKAVKMNSIQNNIYIVLFKMA